MVQRTSVRGINRYGRTSQGVRVMHLRDGDEVSAVALVVESDAPTITGAADEPVTLSASGDSDEPAVTGELTEDAPVGEDEGVIAADPADDSMLQPPEVAADGMPDSDLEE
jgi:DNA gyrase subunit A